MSLAVKHNGVFVTWLITKYDWSRKACLRTSSVMPPLPSLYYEYSPILLPPNRGASLLFIRSRRSRLESPRSMRNSALSTYSSVLSSKAQTSGFSCLNNSTICLSSPCPCSGLGCSLFSMSVYTATHTPCHVMSYCACHESDFTDRAAMTGERDSRAPHL